MMDGLMSGIFSFCGYRFAIVLCEFSSTLPLGVMLSCSSDCAAVCSLLVFTGPAVGLQQQAQSAMLSDLPIPRMTGTKCGVGADRRVETNVVSISGSEPADVHGCMCLLKRAYAFLEGMWGLDLTALCLLSVNANADMQLWQTRFSMPTSS